MKAIIAPVAILLLSFFASAPLYAGELTCVYSGSEKYWINQIRIDTSAGIAEIDTGPYQSKIATVQARLAYADKSQLNGYPALAFDAPAGQPDQRNVFKLFRVMDHWRLIDAGIKYVNGAPTLLALGESVPFNCRGNWP
ncbi:hypothetical protein EOS_42325 [Caballeronia mineralivorans PML1(12)]|uniref:Uncharacterized protein n=1 Tax=Caballeronia mineralivorans PML1(12) TaxID=908627 RepID=A0A0J1CHX8_9BURK|nr:hypothetical protein [Caballeronia mineralivorans]KLU20257.1 hypothetical protein EOS_42325 [Caballeronia mineralivorans PML1(12)]